MTRYRTEFYKDRGGKFRWRSIAPNGQIVVCGDKGYKRRTAALNNLLRAQKALRLGRLVDSTRGK